MKFYLLLLVISIGIAIHIYATLPVLLLIVIALALYLPAKIALIGSVSFGLVTDLLLGSSLGVHGLFYLLSSFSIILYQRRFHSRSVLFVGVFVLLLSILYYQIFFQAIFFKTVVFLVLVMVIVQRLIGDTLFEEKKRLRL